MTKRGSDSIYEGIGGFLCVVYIIAILVYFAAIHININVRYTIFDLAAGFGNLLSDRYTTIQWWALFLASLRVFVPASFILMIINRRREREGWIGFWNVILGVAVIIDVFVLIYFAISFSTCNGLKSRGNLCNDPLWCCIPDVYNIAANGCPPGPCTMANPPVTLPTTLDDLVANGLFKWTFWVTLGFVILGVILLIFSIIVNVYDAQYRLKRELKQRKEEGFLNDDDDEGDNYTENEKINSSLDIEQFNNNNNRSKITSNNNNSKGFSHISIGGSVRQRTTNNNNK